MSPEVDLPRTFVADVYERHARHFVDLLVRTLERPKGPVNALDLSCGVGFATLEVARILPATSRIALPSPSTTRDSIR